MPRALFASACRGIGVAAGAALLLLIASPPVWAAVSASPDAAIASEDTPVTIPVLANDFTDGSPLVITGVSPASNGTAVIAGSEVQYTPDADFVGSDSFSYDITADGFTDSATVFVTVSPVNDPPIAVADVASATEDTAAVVPVLSNDSDPEGGTLTLVAVGPAGFGDAIISGTDVLYTPDPDFAGPDLFTYSVADNQGGVALGVVTMTVSPANDPPVAVDDAVTTVRDAPVTINVVANDTDVDGDPLSVATVAAPASGTTAISGSSAVLYTPDPGFAGADSFTYTVEDPSGATSVATVAVTVSATNRSPIALDDLATTEEDVPVTLSPLTNDSDPDGNPLAISTVGSPSHGTVVTNADQTITYAPEPGFSGIDAFAYTVEDGAGGNDSGVVTISVASDRGLLVAIPDNAVAREDESVVIDVLANDSGDTALAIQSVGTPAFGSAALLGDGTIQYTPRPDFSGPDSFTYVVVDGDGNVATTLVSVIVDPVNDQPAPSSDYARTQSGVPVRVTVLANDSDVDGDPLFARLVKGPENGVVSLSDQGLAEYTPNADFVGVDSFQYEACDGGACSTSRVVVEVTPVPALPPIEIEPAADLPQSSTALPSGPLAGRPSLSPSIGLNIASQASIDSLRALLLPLTLLGVIMVWALTAGRLPWLFLFWRRKKDDESGRPAALD